MDDYETCALLYLVQLVGAARYAALDREAIEYCTSVTRPQRQRGYARRGEWRTWPVAMRGFLLYPKAGVEEFSGNPADGCRFLVRVPSQSRPGHNHYVEISLAEGVVANYRCTCEWSAYHFTPCTHVYAATYAIIAPILREHGFQLDPSPKNFVDTGDYVFYMPPSRSDAEYKLVNMIIPYGLCMIAKTMYLESKSLQEVIDEMEKIED